jgi:hypothetical protein
VGLELYGLQRTNIADQAVLPLIVQVQVVTQMLGVSGLIQTSLFHPLESSLRTGLRGGKIEIVFVLLSPMRHLIQVLCYQGMQILFLAEPSRFLM